MSGLPLTGAQLTRELHRSETRQGSRQRALYFASGPDRICVLQSGNKASDKMTLPGRWTAFLNARWKSSFLSLSGEQERELANNGDGQPVVSTPTAPLTSTRVPRRT